MISTLLEDGSELNKNTEMFRFVNKKVVGIGVKHRLPD